MNDLFILSHEQLAEIPWFLPKDLKSVKSIFKQYKSWLE